MAKREHRYFLKVDEYIADFKSIKAFPNMESFLQLSIFTGLFQNASELLKALVSLGLIATYDENSAPEIVKYDRIREKYTPITNDIIYKRAFALLHISSLKEFFYKNRHDYAIIREIIEQYRAYMEEMISVLSEKIMRLKNGSNSEENVQDELHMREDSLYSFRLCYGIIDEILNLLETLNDKTFTKDLDLKYVYLLNKFVHYETHYIEGTKESYNYRRIARLAFVVSSFLDKYPQLQEPTKTRAHDLQREKLLKILKAELAKPHTYTHFQKSEDTEEIDESQTHYDLLDPDSYMFLEEEDFARLITETSEQSEITSIENDIECLRWLKGENDGAKKHK